MYANPGTFRSAESSESGCNLKMVDAAHERPNASVFLSPKGFRRFRC